MPQILSFYDLLQDRVASFHKLTDKKIVFAYLMYCVMLLLSELAAEIKIKSGLQLWFADGAYPTL